MAGKSQIEEAALPPLTTRLDDIEILAEEEERDKQSSVKPVDLSSLTDKELHQECKANLVLMMRNAKGDLKALGAVRELLDRIEGKPVQRILEKTQRIPDGDLISNEERARQADEEADRMLKIAFERSQK